MSGCSSGGSNSSGGTTTVTTPTPAISSITPARVPAGSTAVTLTITGSGFLTSSTVQVGNVTEASSYVSATQLTATIPATQLGTGANIPVVVFNGALSSPSNSGTSLEVDNPAPSIASTSPSSAPAATASAVVTITGTGFVPSTVVNVNGSARATTFINSTQVSAALSTADFATAGTLLITAVNPTPGGGASAPASLQVNDPTVGTILLSPSTLYTGATSAATVTVTGSTFVPASVVQVNSSPRSTTYVSPTSLTFAATTADLAAVANLAVTVVNPAPGGGTSPAAVLHVLAPPSTPVVTSVSPTSFLIGSPASTLTVVGSNFTSTSVVQWNGANLNTTLVTFYGGAELFAAVPASDLTATGSVSITVTTPYANPTTSNTATVTINNPPAPTLTALSPNAGPLNTTAAVTLTGNGFTGNTTVALNGQTIPSTFVSSTQLMATFPAANIAVPGNMAVTVTTPAPGGGTSSSQVFTTYLSIPNNDLVYNSADGMLYASIPASGAGVSGNSIAAIDPTTGTITRQFQVGSNPNKLALSTDGTQLFVGLDGSASVAQVNLAQGKVVNQFYLGGGPGVYNAPYTAQYLAGVPGSPNSVAVAITGSFLGGSGVTIYDSGVARPNSSTGVGEGPLSFGTSASTLYMAGSSLENLSVTSTGVASASSLYSSSGTISSLQYDNGALYLSTGAVVSAATGKLAGTFYSSGSSQANGPIVSDSTLGRAFIAQTSYTSSAQILAFDETSFNLLGSIPVNGLGTAGYPTSFRKIVRWGQHGLAVAAVPSSFTSNNQIFIFQSPLVKDVSSLPADLSVSLTVPPSATTGTAVNWVATVTNAGPNSAVGGSLALSLDPSLILNTVTSSQGSCVTGTAITCDLGGLASAATATITVSATPTASGTLAATAAASSSSYDPNPSNNQSTTSLTVTGALYAPVPVIMAISPNLVQAGSATFTLNVTGTGFNSGSTVNLGNSALSTTYVSATKLTATVTAVEIATYGWEPVTVSSPAPGGGTSQVIPLTIYALVNVPANNILFDPYAQLLYATVPSSATGITGNSLVPISPFTATVGTPVPVGSQPTVMAESADGKDLYISVSGANSIAQFDLLHGKLLATIAVPSQPNSYYNSSTAATGLAVMPGSDTTLAVDLSGSEGILDINGSTGTFRANVGGNNFPTFGDATHLYTYDNTDTGFEFYRYTVNANGLTLIDGTTLNGMGGFGESFVLANGLIYGAGGGISNPATTPPSQVASLPGIDFYGSGNAGPAVATAPDPSLQKNFLMLENTAGTWAYGLVRYDLKSYLPEAVLPMPASASGVDSNWTMLRFGQDGLALLSYDNFGVSPATSVMLLLRGPFVAPQELGAAGTPATLAPSSVTSVAHGSGNILLTLTGSNLLPGVAVTWNGSYRTTTIVDATHLTVAVPASDLATAGTASIVATNPGASASNTLQLTIN